LRGQPLRGLRAIERRIAAVATDSWVVTTAVCSGFGRPGNRHSAPRDARLTGQDQGNQQAQQGQPTPRGGAEDEDNTDQGEPTGGQQGNDRGNQRNR
jgi:hypothetical protein